MIDWGVVLFGVIFAVGFTVLVLVIVVVGKSNDRARLKYYQRNGKWPTW